jgi:hypothetical protein
MIPSVNTLQQLNDLPSTFTRPGAPYTEWIDALNAGMACFAGAADSTLAQTFSAAQFGWLDVWGAIFSIQRNANESDGAYRVRITFTLLAWVGTVPAIQAWGLEILNTPIEVTENVGSVGYSLTFPASLTTSQITLFLASLVRVRPAGVPFTIAQAQVGLFLDTINYLDEYAVVGGYLSEGALAEEANIGALTNSTQPLLPEYYFADPTLNTG